MKLVSKLAFATAAVASFSGFVFYPGAGSSAPGAAAPLPPAAHALPHAAFAHCPGNCEVWAVMARVR